MKVYKPHLKKLESRQERIMNVHSLEVIKEIRELGKQESHSEELD